MLSARGPNFDFALEPFNSGDSLAPYMPSVAKAFVPLISW